MVENVVVVVVVANSKVPLCEVGAIGRYFAMSFPVFRGIFLFFCFHFKSALAARLVL